LEEVELKAEEVEMEEAELKAEEVELEEAEEAQGWFRQGSEVEAEEVQWYS